MTDSNETTAKVIVKDKAHSAPATPSNTRFSAVIVPVLSKQHTSTCPANGIRNGSVQKMAVDVVRGYYVRDRGGYVPYLERATREALTARESSIGNSGGTTLVIIRMQSRRSLDFLRPLSIPAKPSHSDH